jgi:hypothetical protein
MNNWRLKFNITGSLTAGPSNFTITIAGVTFPATNQAVVAYEANLATRATYFSMTVAGGGGINVILSGAAGVRVSLYGDVLLASQPNI